MVEMRDVAVLRFTEPVSGANTRRQFGRRALASRVQVAQVHPEVLRAAHQALRDGERIVLVSETTVRLVPR